MKTIYVSGYSVSGIKSFDQTMYLSFCKKTLDSKFDVSDYHIKGIYGPTGSGKSALLTSVVILKNMLLHPSYLQHSIIQSKFDSIIHKTKKELCMCVDFFTSDEANRTSYRYELVLGKDEQQQFSIKRECLYVKTARSFSIPMKKVFEHDCKQEFYLDASYDTDVVRRFLEVNKERLKVSSLIALSKEKTNKACASEALFQVVSSVFSLAMQTHVYVESLNYSFLCQEEKMQEETQTFTRIKANQNEVRKQDFTKFKHTIKQLQAYLTLFKQDLKAIKIEKKEDHGRYLCDLIMCYEDYEIHADQESRGMRKLLSLYPYFKAVKQGGIVFIDDFDTYLHEVYGMALLEYLLAQGKGQLCFTSNNVAYMDVLKQSKKSIDFINEKQELHSWITNGNYSPSKLYRAKAIEGTNFTIQQDDFKNVF